MIIPVAALLLVLAPAALGGRLRRLAEVRLRGAGAILATLVVQVVAVEVPVGPHWLLAAAHMATYAAAGAFLWANRRVPGLVVIGLGAASNGLAIALNGGTLPASAQALRRAGMAADDGAFVNSGLLAHPRLAFLGDVFAVPAGWPLHNVFSVGDVVVVLGAGYASLRICGARGLRPWSPAGGRHAQPRHLAAAGVPRPRRPWPGPPTPRRPVGRASAGQATPEHSSAGPAGD